MCVSSVCLCVCALQLHKHTNGNVLNFIWSMRFWLFYYHFHREFVVVVAVCRVKENDPISNIRVSWCAFAIRPVWIRLRLATDRRMNGIWDESIAQHKIFITNCSIDNFSFSSFFLFIAATATVGASEACWCDNDVGRMLSRLSLTWIMPSMLLLYILFYLNVIIFCPSPGCELLTSNQLWIEFVAIS